MSVVSVSEPMPVPVKLADPGALGLGAFALTTFVLSLANTGWVPAAGASVLAVALFYGGLAQFAAGMWEFARGNTFAATAFTSFGAFWLSFWWLETNPAVAQQAGPSGVGTYLLAWAIFTAYMTIAAVKTNRVTLAVFALLTITFLALAIGAFTGLGGISQAGGWLGLATALAAWYGSAATVVNATWGRAVFPVGAFRS
ncbi:hypothetical protein E3O44_16065 [Cryobacterium algoricola]|uniref:Acetate uptake transporter n=2 Tax=Cryobacterium TaxID=69578 RepID=A0AA41QYV0_9MICO|nr:MULTISPECIES: GPR1/FUN34/YaaH family transporter [Cryobacterium]MCI4659359.1 acetate uptake transporter [Cryobacterium zhongshanensis]TFB84008.1 hypothetical protein E3O44_16065 [Cryobacterium algoricola]